MIQMRNFLSLATALLVAVFALQASPAKADFQLYLQEAGVNGGAITSVASGADFTSISFSGTYGDFKVKVFGGSSDNGTDLSDLFQSTTTVQNLSGSTKTLHLYVVQTNYTLPSSPVLAIESSLGGSVTTGTLGMTGIFQAYADPNNANPISNTGVFTPPSYTNGPQNGILNGGSYDTGSASGSFTQGSGGYSLTGVVTFDLSGGGKANFGDQINVTPTPAPAGVLLALSAFPCLGIGAWLRRRRNLAVERS
jgi:hypothetical protein